MEHRHGDCMMSLRWELLPRKLRDVIAPETVAMVTEVTGRKGVVISRMAGNVPINGNKEDAFIYVFLFQGGLPVIPSPRSFPDTVCSVWVFIWSV